MDTLRRYHIEDGTLDNVEEDDEGTILLDDTGGGFSQNGGGVYSLNTMIVILMRMMPFDQMDWMTG
jgi:hypothetical protein